MKLMQQSTAREAAIDDAMTLIESLELPYLIALQQRLGEHIAARRAAARSDAIAEVRRIAAGVGMSLEELLAGRASPKAASTTKAKYRDPASGATWSGMGRAPSWIRNKNYDEFLI